MRSLSEVKKLVFSLRQKEVRGFPRTSFCRFILDLVIASISFAIATSP